MEHEWVGWIWLGVVLAPAIWWRWLAGGRTLRASSHVAARVVYRVGNEVVAIVERLALAVLALLAALIVLSLFMKA